MTRKVENSPTVCVQLSAPRVRWTEGRNRTTLLHQQGANLFQDCEHPNRSSGRVAEQMGLSTEGCPSFLCSVSSFKGVTFVPRSQERRRRKGKRRQVSRKRARPGCVQHLKRGRCSCHVNKTKWQKHGSALPTSFNEGNYLLPQVALSCCQWNLTLHIGSMAACFNKEIS